MPNYRVISEPNRTAHPSCTSTHRRLRGDDRIKRTVTHLLASDILKATQEAVASPGHTGNNIVSIEERVPAETLSFTDHEISEALLLRTDGIAKLAREDFPVTESVYEESDFNNTVALVVELLADSLIPGLSISVVSDLDGDHFAMVEVRDEATGTYISTTAATRDLTEDRSATGWKGVVAIAKALIYTAEPLI